MNKRLISMLMCFVMITGIIPAGRVQAAEDLLTQAVSEDSEEEITEEIIETLGDEAEGAVEVVDMEETVPEIVAEEEHVYEISQKYSVSQLSVSGNDQRDVSISVSDDQVYVAFFDKDNKYIKHITMDKGGVVSENDIPEMKDTATENFVGWYTFELDRKETKVEADGTRTVYVVESEDSWESSVSVNKSLRISAKYTPYIPTVDERDKEIASAGDGMVYVAFFSKNKYIKHIYMPKGSVVSVNEIPEVVSGNYIGWYPYNVDTTQPPVVDERGNRSVSVIESDVKWDMTIRVDDNMRLQAKFSNMKMDNTSPMNPIYALSEEDSDIYLVKGQKVSYNQAFTTYPKKILKNNTAKTMATAQKVGEATITLPSGKVVKVHVVKPKLKKKQTAMYIGSEPVDINEVGWENKTARDLLGRAYWQSSNPNVVRMNGSVAYPVNKGTVTIYAYIGGQKFTTKLTVKNADYYSTPGTVLPVNLNVNKPKTVKFMGVVNKDATWSTAQPYICDVTAKGKLKPGATPGVTTFTCDYATKRYNGIVYVEDPKPHVDEPNADTTVLGKMVYVKKKYRVKLEEGGSYLIKFDSENLRQNVVFKSSAPTKVYVDETGLIVARKAGAKATLSCKINGKTLKIYVNTLAKDQRKVDKPDVCLEVPKAVPDDGVDDTGAINEALQNVGPEDNYTVYLGPGEYNISCGNWGGASNNPIRFDEPNRTLIMDPKCVLKMKPTKKGGYCVFKIYAKNITIKGGEIAGERADHAKYEDDGGHGIYISGGAKNILIEDMKIHDNHGDGIDLDNGCSDITIKNCYIYDNFRSQISMVNTSNVTIDNCNIYSTLVGKGAAHPPMAAINIEPNKHDDGKYYTDVKNVTVKDSTLKAAQPHLVDEDPWSYYFAFLVLDLDKVQNGAWTADGITIDHCTFEGDFYNGSGGNMRIQNNTTINGNLYDKRKASIDASTKITGNTYFK